MDDFHKGAKEWGSKARKDENPKCRAKLKRQVPKLLEEAKVELYDNCPCGGCCPTDEEL